MIVLPDPWDALAIARLLPGETVVSYEAAGVRAEFEKSQTNHILAQPSGELTTLRLITEHAPPSGIEPVIAFKPSARLEKTGRCFALSSSSVAGAIENKLNLSSFAQEAGVPIARQEKETVGENSFDVLAERFGLPFVAQSPRGFAGRRTFRVDDAQDWSTVEALLARRPVKLATWAPGRPGTSNAVVDSAGRVMVSAPILQLTGEPDLTPYPLGSCGNDFTWRPGPHPGDAPASLAEALGPVLAARGYRGHFGIDWVWDGSRCTLIEINARLTASFAVYVSHQPELLYAHLSALRGEAIEPRRLPSFEAGQLVSYNRGDQKAPPLVGSGCWPAPGSDVEPGAKRGRLVVRGPIVDANGGRVIFLD